MNEREALKLALKALEYPLNQSYENFNVDMAELLSHRAVTAIKEVLAQPEQEPVAYTGNGTAGREADVKPTGFFFQMPPQRTWVGLTDEEIEHIKLASGDSISIAISFTNDKLKEKNT